MFRIEYNTIENVFKSTSVVCYKISYEQLIKITSSTRSRTFSHKYDLARFIFIDPTTRTTYRILY